MGEAELKRALRREGDERVRGFWSDAEQEVAQRRSEAEAAIASLRDEGERRLQAECRRLRSSLLFDARARAMSSRLQAEAALAERLLQLAGELLPQLAGRDRATTWQALATELPAGRWATVTVTTADLSAARDAFPDAVIASDDRLGGGLVAAGTDDMLRVDNSLACRLQRAWPDLLPGLMAELRALVDNHEADRPDTAR